MAVIWWLSAQPDLSSGLKQDFFLRKCAHATEYAVLTLLWARAVAGLAPRPRAGLLAPGVAAAIALAWAVSDEWHQTFVPGRVGSPRDVAVDAAGIAIGLALLRWDRVGGRLLGRSPGPGSGGAARP
jgi:VanZ family protein